VLSVLGRRGFVVDDIKDGNATGAGSLVVGDTFWLELLVAGGVDEPMIDGEGARMLLPWINSRRILQRGLVVRLRLGKECFNAIALLTSTVTRSPYRLNGWQLRG
jgi:hypothetical protein